MDKKFFANPFPANNQIRAKSVICLDESGNNLGQLPISQALNLAKEANLDLVQVAFSKKDQVVTCKITDYGRFKFDQQKKQKEQARKQRENKVEEREIQFRVTTEINDLRVKARKAQEFLDQGHRVKVVVKFHGREMSHPEIGKQTLRDFIECLSNNISVGIPSFTGKDLIVLISSMKNKI